MDLLPYLATEPWAILPDALDALVAFLENDGALKFLAAREGKPLDGARKVSVRDGVAVVPVTGLITRRANLFSELFGATTLDALAKNFQAALDDPAVHSILLDIDSPGGEAAGVGEMASRIFAARGQKPTMAYVGSLGASAAYYLASACSEVVANPSAQLGSIGVIASVDTKEKPGVLTLRSSVSPNKALPASTPEGRSALQERIDALADVFLSDVARFRNTTPGDVQTRFGGGAVRVGAGAVQAGLADRLGDFESSVRGLADRGRSRSLFGAAAGAPKVAAKSAQVLIGERAESHREGVPMSFREKFLALLDSLGASTEDERKVEPEAAAVGMSPGEGAKVSEVDVEALARAKAEQMAEERLKAAFEGMAKAYFADQVKANLVVPAEVTSLTTLYADFAAADHSHPLPDGVSRINFLRTSIEGRKTHGLCREFLAEDADGIEQKLAGLKVLPSAVADPDEAARAKANSDVERMLASTSLGQTVLAERKAK